MPINLERSLINSNLDSYLGEAGLGGWAGLNVPGMSMWQWSWSPRRGGAVAVLLLPSWVPFPSEDWTKVTKGRSSGHRLLPQFYFCACNESEGVETTSVMPFKWFISLKRMSSEPGCTQTLLSQTSLTRSDLPQQRSKWGPPIPATSTLITRKKGSKHCLSFLGIFSQEVRDPAVSPQANSLYLGEKKYFLVLFLEFREKIRI